MPFPFLWSLEKTCLRVWCGTCWHFLFYQKVSNFAICQGQICTIYSHFALKDERFRYWSLGHLWVHFAQRNPEPKGLWELNQRGKNCRKKRIKLEGREIARLEIKVPSKENVFPFWMTKNGRKNCAEPFPTPQSHVKTCVLVLSTSKRMDLFPVCKLSYCSHTFPRAKIVLGLPWLLPSKQEERRLWFSLLPKQVQPLKGHAEMKLSPKYP